MFLKMPEVKNVCVCRCGRVLSACSALEMYLYIRGGTSAWTLHCLRMTDAVSCGFPDDSIRYGYAHVYACMATSRFARLFVSALFMVLVFLPSLLPLSFTCLASIAAKHAWNAAWALVSLVSWVPKLCCYGAWSILSCFQRPGLTSV